MFIRIVMLYSVEISMLDHVYAIGAPMVYLARMLYSFEASVLRVYIHMMVYLCYN